MGVEVIDEALPAGVAEVLRERFLCEDGWEHRSQKVESRPGDPDPYRAEFDRHQGLRFYRDVVHAANTLVRPMVEKSWKGRVGSGFDLKCYRMRSGDFFHTHTDERAGKIGFVLYLVREWFWDWGGVLHSAVGVETVPRFNRLVIITNDVPHSVSEVMPWAKEPRYTLCGFVR